MGLPDRTASDVFLIFCLGAAGGLFAYFYHGKPNPSTPKQSGEFSIDVQEYPVQGRLLEDEEYFQALKTSLEQAEESIDVIMYVFRIEFNEDGQDPALKLANVLKQQAQDGVEVRVLLSSMKEPKKGDDLKKQNQKTARYLRKAGVKAHVELVPDRIHGKVAVIDDDEAFVSNHNWTWSALKHNAELAMQYQGEGIKHYVVPEIERVFDKL